MCSRICWSRAVSSSQRVSDTTASSSPERQTEGRRNGGGEVQGGLEEREKKGGEKRVWGEGGLDMWREEGERERLENIKV